MSWIDLKPIENGNNRINEAETTQKNGTSYKLFREAVSEYTPKHTVWIPDWKDASSYCCEPGKTRPSEWAWEFLRRNRKYQREYDKPGLARNASQWGLAISYKNYANDFSPETCSDELNRTVPQSPIWGILTPTYLQDRTVAGPWDTAKYSGPTKKGVVLVAFDLNVETVNPNFLKVQLTYLESKLKVALERIRKQSKKVKKFAPEEGNLLTYLRVADALSCPERIELKEIGQVLHREGLVLKDKPSNGLTDARLSKAIEHHIEVAYKLIYKHGYLDLLI